MKYPVSCCLMFLLVFCLAGGPLAAKQPGLDIAKLVEQLDSPRFAERQAASHKVTLAGNEAIEPLKVAAIGGSQEQTKRAIEVLQKFLKSGEVKTRDLARSAIVEISTSDNKGAALRAKAALEAKRRPVSFQSAAPWPPGQAPQIVRAPRPFQIRQAGGPIQIRFKQNGIAQGMRVQIINGVKDITVNEGARTIKIHDDPNQGIEISVIEKKAGKTTTQKYAAKDAQNLKKQHPEIFKLYEKFSKNNPAAAIKLQVKPLR